MLHAIKGTDGAIAAVSALAMASIAVVVLSATVVGERIVAMQKTNAAAVQGGGESVAAAVNREGKGDRLAVPAAPQARAEIRSVEVIGVRGASVVYRDRDGNVLFRTDPLDNVTVVTKNVELPEVTIRESAGTEVERVPAEPAEEAGPGTQPHGCESAFARPSPESLTRMSSRCVTQVPSHGNFAALR